MNINEKITLKGLTTNFKLLVMSNYSICEYNHNISELQIEKNKYDVISLNPKLFVHKHITGRYFTYRISSNPNCEFTYSENFGDIKKTIGDDGIIKVLKIQNYFKS